MYIPNHLKQTIVAVAKQMFQRLTREVPSVQVQSLYKPRPNGKPSSTVSGGSRNRKK
ncbi:MAG: hypothetical protein AAGI69_01730 [Cyanobacteria bacterium P01_H01_bin.21]